MFFGCCCFLWLYAHVLEARGQIQMAFLRRHLPCILKQDWFLRLAASPLDQAAWPENPREPPAWLPGIVFHRILFVYMGSGHLNQVLSLQGKLFYKHSVFSWCLRIDLCALQRYLYSFSFYLQALMLLKWVANYCRISAKSGSFLCVRNVSLWYELLGVPHQEACVHLCLC